MLELLCNTARLRLLGLLEYSDETHTSSTHTLVLLFDIIRVEGLEDSGLPDVLAGGPVSYQLPKVLEGFNLLLALVDLRVLRGGHFQVLLLSIDLDHTLGQLGKSLVDLIDHLVVVVLLLLDGVLLELID